MSTKKKLLQAAAGVGGAGLDVDEVFSSYTYTGTGAEQTINNGLDLLNEGGLVWVKNRITANTNDHSLFDSETVTGSTFPVIAKAWESNVAGSLATRSAGFTFTSTGFKTTSNGRQDTDQSGIDFITWSFRRAPKFFDVVNYTGDGNTSKTISHNLGAVPGMMIVLGQSTGDYWVYHRDVGNTKYLELNKTTNEITSSSAWNNTTPTDTQFTVGNGTPVNNSGSQYTVYLFAHNDGDGEFGPDSDQDIIKCGSYTGNELSDGPEINLGFEPQFIVAKQKNGGTGDWFVVDTMRGLTVSNLTHTDEFLMWNLSSATTTAYGDMFAITPTGFKLVSPDRSLNESPDDYIYMAIRRGPLAEPESATDVFDVTSYTADNTDNRVITTGNKVDTLMARNRNNTSARGFVVGDRLRGLKYLSTALTANELNDADGLMGFDHNTAFEVGNDSIRALNYSNYTQIAYTWTRAPGFFDVRCYNGTGTAQNITHSLGVTPEFYIVKRRDSTGAWYAYHKSIDVNGDGLPETDAIQFNANSAAFDSASYWNDTAPTATTFTVGTTSAVNASGGTYVAYLFASLDGIAKVGGYTGNGSSSGPTVNLGFAPRFVFITKWGGTAGGGNKYAFDTERGIVAGNDPFLDFRNTNAEDSSSDLIDPDSNGFTISSSNGNINASGGEYMFYAIA